MYQLCLSANVLAKSFLRSGWNRISALSLFVENILLGIEEVRENLTPLVLEHTRRLAKVGLCTMQFPALLFFKYNNALPLVFMFLLRYWRKAQI